MLVVNKLLSFDFVLLR